MAYEYLTLDFLTQIGSLALGLAFAYIFYKIGKKLILVVDATFDNIIMKESIYNNTLSKIAEERGIDPSTYITFTNDTKKAKGYEQLINEEFEKKFNEFSEHKNKS